MDLNQSLIKLIQKLLLSEINSQIQYSKISSLSANNSFNGIQMLFRKLSQQKSYHIQYIFDFLKSRKVYIFEGIENLQFNIKNNEEFDCRKIFEDAFQLELQQQQKIEQIGLMAYQLNDILAIDFIQAQLKRQNEQTNQMREYLVKFDRFKEDKSFNFHFDNELMK